MFIIRISFAHTTPKPQKGAKRVEEQNRRSGRGRRVKLAAVYLLAALAAALAALPDWGPTPIATEQQAKTS